MPWRSSCGGSIVDRRSLLKALTGGVLVAAAPPLILPEKTIWQLDRTMLTPRCNAGLQTFDKIFPGWQVIRRKGLSAPYEEWFVCKPIVPGAGFSIRFDLTYPRELIHQRLFAEITREIAQRESLMARHDA